MALPAHLASRFSPALSRALRMASEPEAGVPGFGFGVEALDAILPDAGILRGGVVELSVGEGVPATSLLLSACASLQKLHEKRGQELPWCAFVDPSASLYAPGVVDAGVRLARLLVVRPPSEAVARTALRLAKSPAFALVIVDTIGIAGARLSLPHEAWPRFVRRLALEVEGSERSVVLLTDRSVPRALPLPVAQRIEIQRPSLERLQVQVVKDRRGQVTAPRPVAWAGRQRAAITELAEVRHAG
jgi:hypothetical protein